MNVHMIDTGQQSPSRRRLLDAGIVILSTKPQEIARRGITADLVCDYAGLARRTFYAQFETVEEYVDQLSTELDRRLAGVEAPAAEGLSVCDGDLRAAIKSSLATELAFHRQRSSVVRSLALLGRPCPTLDSQGSTWRVLIDDLLSLGLQASPKDVASTETALTCLVVGYLETVEVIDIGSAIETLLRPAEQLLLSMTDPTVDDDPDRLIVRAARVRQAWLDRSISMSVPNVRELVFRAAESLIENDGPHAVSLASIARATGVSRTIVARYVGLPDQIIASLVKEHTPGLAVVTERSVSAGLDRMSIGREHRRTVLSLMQERPAFSRALFWQLLRDGGADANTTIDWPSPDPGRPLLEFEQKLLTLAAVLIARSELATAPGEELLERIASAVVQRPSPGGSFNSGHED